MMYIVQSCRRWLPWGEVESRAKTAAAGLSRGLRTTMVAEALLLGAHDTIPPTSGRTTDGSMVICTLH